MPKQICILSYHETYLIYVKRIQDEVQEQQNCGTNHKNCRLSVTDISTNLNNLTWEKIEMIQIIFWTYNGIMQNSSKIFTEAAFLGNAYNSSSLKGIGAPGKNTARKTAMYSICTPSLLHPYVAPAATCCQIISILIIILPTRDTQANKQHVCCKIF